MSTPVAEALVAAHLENYVPTIVEELGYEELSDLPTELEDWQTLATSAKLKPGHKKRWEAFVGKVGGDVVPAAAQPEPMPNPPQREEAAGPTTQIWIKTPSGETIGIEATGTDHIADIKGRVAVASCQDVTWCRLVFAGRELVDER
jgi:hypothetical protein